MGKISIIIFLLLGVGGTIIMFILRAISSQYGMNPLSFIACIVPLIISLPVLLFDDNDYKGE